MKEFETGFDEVIVNFDNELRSRLSLVPRDIKEQVSEIRLNPGYPIILVLNLQTLFVGKNGRIHKIYTDDLPKVSISALRNTFITSCGYSVHSCEQSLKSGYVTLKGGHRMGIAAKAVMDGNEVHSVKDISYLNYRITHEAFGAGREIYENLWKNGYHSFIIAGPPSSGKTTVIRDLARILSDLSGSKSYRTCIIDERDEIASVHNGQAQNIIGGNCCVLSSFPKHIGIMNAMRSLSPQVIFCDEISDVKETERIIEGVNSGIDFILTVHAGSITDIRNKKQLKMLFGTDVFQKTVILTNDPLPCTIKKIADRSEILQ